MNRFIFRLQTVLKHRETLEDLRDQELAHAQGLHEQERLQLEALEAHYRQTIAERPRLSAPQAGAGAAGDSGFDAPAIVSREKYVEALQIRIAEQGERVEVARLIVEEKRVAMVAAKQAREAVSRLRDKDLADHQAEAQRKAQESTDEIASVRFVRQQIAESLERSEAANRQRRQAEFGAPTDAPTDGRKAE